MTKKTNWPKLLYIFCWGALLNGLLFSSGLLTEKAFAVPNASPLPHFLKVFIWIAMFLLLCIIVYMIFHTFRRMRSTKQSSGVAFWNFYLLFVASFAIFALCAALLPSLKACRIATGILTAVLLAVLIPVLVFSDPRSPSLLSLEKNKSRTLWHTALFSLTLLGSTFWVPGMWGIPLPALQLPGDLLGYYGAQLSLTFITISVMSVLSDKSVVVYWENIAEANLIKPLFGSFASYTAYSITATVGSGISVLLGDHLAFAVFFALNILTLILLTLTMVDVYYGRDNKKKGLQKALQRTAAACRQTALLQSMPENSDLTISLAANVTEYRDNMLRLQHHLHRAIDDHDIPYINELLELYGQNMECFQTPEGRTVEALLLQSTETPWETILLSLDQSVSERENAQTFGDDPFLRNRWNTDALLWKSFAESKPLQEYLAHLPSQSEVPDLLCWAVIHRMTVLTNDMIAPLYRPLNGRYLSDVTFNENRLHFRVNSAALLNAFKVYGSQLVLQPELLCALCRLLLLAKPHLSDAMQQSLTSCPFLPLLEVCLKEIPNPTPTVAQLQKDWPFTRK